MERLARPHKLNGIYRWFKTGYSQDNNTLVRFADQTDFGDKPAPTIRIPQFRSKIGPM